MNNYTVLIATVLDGKGRETNEALNGKSTKRHMRTGKAQTLCAPMRSRRS